MGMGLNTTVGYTTQPEGNLTWCTEPSPPEMYLPAGSVEWIGRSDMLYKLTDQAGRTYGDGVTPTQWGVGITNEATGNPEQGLCSNAWIHAYESPLIAILMNPSHANLRKPLMWEAKGEVGLREGQVKCGCRTLTTLRMIEVPEISLEQHVRFAIATTLAVYNQPVYRKWALAWLDGSDRSASAADAARAAVRAAAYATSAARAAAYAAYAAAYAAYAAADAAYAANAADAAANAAVYAAAYAAADAVYLDLRTIAEWALTSAPLEQLEARLKHG